MKKIILLCTLTNLLIFGNPCCISAQGVGVSGNGAVPDPSALLDVDATSMVPKKGLLIPRVTLTSSADAATILIPATSLLVYNTGTGALKPAGYYYNSGTTGTPAWTSFLTATTGTGTLGDTYNIKIANNATTPDTKIDITGGLRGAKWEVILEDLSAPPNTYKVISSSTITINTGVTGANGIDAGSQAASTWYYIYVISNGTTVAGLISTSSNAPTMPSGYTYRGLAGAVYSDASVNFRPFNQFGKNVTLNGNVSILNDASPATSYTSLTLTSVVPPIATYINGMVRFDFSASGDQAFLLAATSGGIGYQEWVWMSPAASRQAMEPFEFGLYTAQTLYYHVSATGASGTAICYITGWSYK